MMPINRVTLPFVIRLSSIHNQKQLCYENKKTKKPKKTSVLTLASAFLFVAFIGATFLNSTRASSPAENARHADCQVTNAQIVSYLEGYGYSNVSVLSGEYYNCDRICDTDYSYNTKVFCTETAIIGHEDIPN
ncbi:MAG: hypothetical protein KDF60_19095 [Calditrichaeota bacterium]|nr:hypothetical protein [Calditrichota bacterium]